VLEPGRGEKQLGLDYAFRASSQAFGTDGLADPTDPPAIWSVHELRLSGAFGLTRKASVGFFVPVVYPRLENGLLDTPLVNPLPYPGDTSFWYHQRLKEDLRAGSSLTLEVRGQAPTGLESPGDQGTTLLTGTGIPELEAGLRWRKRLSGVGLELAGSYQTYISQVVAYTEAVYSAELRGEGRFDPGDRVGGSVVVQLAPASWLFLELENRVGHQAAARVGTTSSRFLPGRDLDPIAGTSGLSAEAALRLRAPLGKTTELWVTSRYRYLGVTIEELSALGLESLSPAPGFSAGVGLHWRH
jgi:hypothetical protein